jgi:hypothetical protein
MALEGKGNALGHPDGRKNTPAGKQTYLSCGQHLLGSFPNAVIVKNETVEHDAILPRSNGLGWE